VSYWASGRRGELASPFHRQVQIYDVALRGRSNLRLPYAFRANFAGKDAPVEHITLKLMASSLIQHPVPQESQGRVGPQTARWAIFLRAELGVFWVNLLGFRAYTPMEGGS
jgi:hypothetical protein